MSKRITPQEALDLAVNASVHELCSLAFKDRVRRHKQRAYFVRNQHINYTNVCKNKCLFCAFARSPGAPDAYVLSVEDVAKRLSSKKDEPIKEIHIVGAFNPELPYNYYLDILKAAKKIRPEAVIKAFTAVEISGMAQAFKMSCKDILEDFQKAGLEMLPGGGAEIFSPKLRKALCPDKISAKAWLEVHRQAHSLGILSNATMLFGHIETWQERIEHMLLLRELQDRTAGFLCYIPLAYQPKNNELNAEGPDGLDCLRTFALARIFLDNFPHIKAYWPMLGIKTAQLCLWAGADDFDGTIVEENIGHRAGATTPVGLTVPQLWEIISAAGFGPIERGARLL